MTSVAAGPEAFREWMAPKVVGIREFTDAVHDVGERHCGLPSPI
jgi:hypothetical protein